MAVTCLNNPNRKNKSIEDGETELVEKEQINSAIKCEMEGKIDGQNTETFEKINFEKKSVKTDEKLENKTNVNCGENITSQMVTMMNEMLSRQQKLQEENQIIKKELENIKNFNSNINIQNINIQQNILNFSSKKFNVYELKKQKIGPKKALD